MQELDTATDRKVTSALSGKSREGIGVGRLVPTIIFQTVH